MAVLMVASHCNAFSFNVTDDFDSTPAKQLFWDDAKIVILRSLDEFIPVRWLNHAFENWEIYLIAVFIAAGLLVYCWSQLADTVYSLTMTAIVLLTQVIFTIFIVAYFDEE
jgi:hypothetical protein